LRKAVVSMAFGNDWWKIASVSFQALSLYAEKIGADFVVMSKRRYPNLHVHWEKLALREIVAEYDRTFYVDADAVIRPTAQSVFDFVPETHFAAHDEMIETGRVDEYRRCAEFYGVDPVPRWYFNAGVLVLSRRHADIFAAPTHFLENSGMPEQNYVNVRTHQLEASFMHLDWRWNTIWGRHQTVEEAAESNLMHYAGLAKYGEGVATIASKMREDLARWKCVSPAVI